MNHMQVESTVGAFMLRFGAETYVVLANELANIEGRMQINESDIALLAQQQIHVVDLDTQLGAQGARDDVEWRHLVVQLEHASVVFRTRGEMDLANLPTETFYRCPTILSESGVSPWV